MEAVKTVIELILFVPLLIVYFFLFEVPVRSMDGIFDPK